MYANRKGALKDMTKEITTTIKIRGVYYYEGKNLLQSKLINIGNKVLLKHTPENQYDENAVEVILSKNKTKLGYLPKEIAAKYVKLLNDSSIKSVQVSSLEPSSNGIYIKIKYIKNENTSSRVTTNTERAKIDIGKIQPVERASMNTTIHPTPKRVNSNTTNSKKSYKTEIIAVFAILWLMIIFFG